MIKNEILCALVAMMVISSCRYENEEALFAEKEKCEDVVSFTSGIENILNSNCAISGCHAAGGISPQLTSYDRIRDRAGDIKRETGSLHMPPASSGKNLSQEEIDLIACWVDQGAHQN